MKKQNNLSKENSTTIDGVEIVRDKLFITIEATNNMFDNKKRDYYIHFHAEEKEFAISDNPYPYNNTLLYAPHFEHFYIRNNTIYIKNYHVDFNYSKKWMIVHVDKSSAVIQMYLFIGLKYIGGLEDGVLKMRERVHLPYFKKSLEYFNIRSYTDFADKKEHFFSDLYEKNGFVYVNSEKVGQVQHLKSTFLKPEHRSIIKLSKTYNPDKLKAIKEVVQANYPDRVIVYYLKEELV